MTILEEIVASKRKEVNDSRQLIPLTVLRKNLENSPAHRSLYNSIVSAEKFHFICEVKKASPSKGIIRYDFQPDALAKEYVQGGAAAISVLTDEKYFHGSLSHLCQVRHAVNIPVLRKEFIIDPYQIFQSKVAGADLILLIACILSNKQIAEYRRLASDMNLEIIVEIMDEDDLLKVESFEQIIIGINNRDLKTFQVDLNRALKLKRKIPEHVPVIGESGIRSVEDCLRLADHGFRGALIGETLMRAENPGLLLREWNRRVNGDHAN